MKVVLRFDKTTQENASGYFEKAKKAKKKLEGLQKAMQKIGEKISTVDKNMAGGKKTRIMQKKERKWFEKFHWAVSSDGFLILAGRDAKSNENLLKKYFEKGDKFFHADITGAAHTIVKVEGKNAPKDTLKEAAQFAAVFSKAWGEKMSSADVYSADFDQVTKQAPSGEAIKTGAFMVYGKREWYKKTPLSFAIGLDKDGNVISGPQSAVKKHAAKYVEIIQGSEKKSEAAKKIRKILQNSGHEVSLDEINQMLPSGELGIKNQQK